MAIQHLKSINEQLVDAQLDYSVKKLLYKEKEAKLLLETDFALANERGQTRSKPCRSISRQAQT